MHAAIAQHRSGIAAICQHYRIRRLEVFGSAARADDFDPEHYSKNFFLDLWDSMSIWDMNKLKNTLFKLQSLKVGLSMDAHDWVLSANIEAGPELVTASSTQPLPHYEMEVAFNLAVTWKDIPAIKGSINYSEGAFER